MADFHGNKMCDKCLTVHATTDVCSIAHSIPILMDTGTNTIISPSDSGAVDIHFRQKTFDAALAIVLDEVNHLVLSKQHDYGHANILAHGLRGLCVRLADKQARLHNNICSDNGQLKNESLRDTFLDIVGYGLLGLMVMDKTFELSLSTDESR